MRKPGRYFVTGSSQRSLPWSTRRASTAAVIAFVFDAILKIDCLSIGAPPASRSPRMPVNVTSPFSITPTAMPGRR